MLAAALEQDAEGPLPGLRLHLAAPTGKAAARLKAAIGEGLGRVPAPIAARLAEAPCTTLHRLLESTGDTFRRNRRHPLALDLLVVDELSMVDLPLMQALLEALPDPARLLLVGDPAQLPPVGLGPVLLELHRPGNLRALGTAAVELITIYRNNGALAEVAAVLRGAERGDHDPVALRRALEGLGEGANLQWQSAAPGRLPPVLRQRLERHLRRLGQLASQLEGKEAQVEPLLEELEACVLLTPVRGGPWGVEAIHRALLGELASQPPRFWPIGTPLLCQRNLPEQGLANGDVGVVVDWAGERQVLFAAPAAQGASADPSRSAARCGTGPGVDDPQVPGQPVRRGVAAGAGVGALGSTAALHRSDPRPRAGPADHAAKSQLAGAWQVCLMKPRTQRPMKRNMPTKSERNGSVSGGQPILQSPEGGSPQTPVEASLAGVVSIRDPAPIVSPDVRPWVPSGTTFCIDDPAS